MKKFAYFLLLLAGLNFASCNPDDTLPYGYIENTVEGSSTFVLKGYENSADGFTVFKTKEFPRPFYLKDKAFTGKAWSFIAHSSTDLASMTTVPADGNWQATAAVVNGGTYWARYAEKTQYKVLKLRVAYIEGNNVGLEYANAGVLEREPSANANQNVVTDKPSVAGLEIPALNTANLYAEYVVEDKNTKIHNFALEYVSSMKHAAWVAFSFDATTSQDNIKRQDKWKQDDPNIPNDVEVQEFMHQSDGFDKGHLIASKDRVYCQPANEQTFYYANISPQIGDFNQGYWQGLEAQVQDWGRATQKGKFDKVYVTKGGTINKLLTNFTGTKKAIDQKYPTTDAEGKTVKGLVVPAYYFMAVLSEKDGEYQAIGFYVPHQEGLVRNPTAGDLQVYAVSIDKLEEETGLDFFCNLPDDIENAVEQAYKKENWTWK